MLPFVWGKAKYKMVRTLIPGRMIDSPGNLDNNAKSPFVNKTKDNQ